MPIYEFVCKDCGHHFDMLLPMKDADRNPVCIHCSRDNVTRVLSLFNAKCNNNGCASGACATTSSSCAGCSGGHCGSCH